MSEQDNPPSLFSQALCVELREIVKEAVQEAMNGHRDADRLLDAEEASKVLSVSPDWLYRHHKELPFSRKLGQKMLRFSSQGIQKYLATRKIA